MRAAESSFGPALPAAPPSLKDGTTSSALEHQRHCDAVTALAARRFDAFLHSQANHAHVHLRPSEPYRQQVEARIYPPVAPSAPSA